MQRAIDWFFRDRTTGAIVIGQWPNLPLWFFAGFTIAHWVAGAAFAGVPGPVLTGLQLAARVSLVWWALDEALRGVNPWRRCLGGAVLLFVSWSVGVAVWGGHS